MSDIVNVINFKRSDKVLLIGCPNLSFIKKYVKDVVAVEKLSNLKRKFIKENHFQKVIFSEEGLDPTNTNLSNQLNTAASMSEDVMVLMSDNAELREETASDIEAYWYPQGECWDLKSNIGDCLVMKVKGSRW